MKSAYDDDGWWLVGLAAAAAAATGCRYNRGLLAIIHKLSLGQIFAMQLA